MNTTSLTDKTRRSGTESLDLATTQAVLVLRDALRALNALNQIVGSNLSPAQQRWHAQRVDAAKWALRESRLGLDQLLDGDA